MQTTLTTKLKLVTTPEQFCQLRLTQLAYRDALNQASQHAFAHGKTSNSQRLHRDLYLRLAPGMVCRRRWRAVCSARSAPPTRDFGPSGTRTWKRAKPAGPGSAFRGLDQPPHYVSPTLTYVLGRDYTFKATGGMSVLTLAGRVVLPSQGYRRHVAWLQHGAQIGGAKLWYDRAKRCFSLLVSLAIDTPDPTPAALSEVVGIDLGQRYLATITTPENHTQFYTGKQVRAKADHYARLQKRLQRKGTRSATRRRIATGQRERRFKLSTNHTIAKQILDTHPHRLIGLEDLTGIRERTRRRKRARIGKQLVPVSPKARKANRHASKWAFAELRGLLTYKATLAGSCCMSVDADYTSQTCPRCGYTSRQNRPKGGLLFVCQHCQFSLHADLVGSRNICLRTLVIRQDWMTTGQLSRAPEGSDREAKTARLSRYAGLRWSLATSLLL